MYVNTQNTDIKRSPCSHEDLFLLLTVVSTEREGTISELLFFSAKTHALLEHILELVMLLFGKIGKA